MSSRSPLSPISATDSPRHFEYVDEAIPLIHNTPDGNSFEINPDAMAFLSSLSSPIAIIGVAGMYRTGKSYLLNRVLLDQKGGFGVGPSINPCTKGIWLWGRPIPGTTDDGKICSIVVLDSEGIGALDEDSDHDTRIFSLALLISSCFIYNSVGAIDESALQNLSLVVNLTKHIHIKTRQSDETDSEEYAAYMPSFVWVLRDFALQLVDSEGESLTPKEYLEKALQPQKGFSDSIEDKNRIRRLLKEFFKDRDCFTLIRPTTKEDDLQNLEEKPLESLRPEFQEQVIQLRKRVIGRIRPKTVNNKCLNGEMLANLVKNYIEAINIGVVPNIESAWNYICKTECTKAVEDAQDIYEKILMSSVSHRFPINEEDLKLLHKEAKEAAMDHFNKIAVGTDRDVYLKQLKETLAQKYDGLKADNELEAQRKCEKFLTDNFQVIDQKLKNGEIKSFLDFEANLRKLQQFYIEHGPDGPFRNEILLEFCLGKYSAVSDFFLKNLTNELNLKDQLTNDQIMRLETEVREAKEDLMREKDEWHRKYTAAISEKAELSAKEQNLKEQVQNMKLEREQVEKELRNGLKNAKNELLQQIESANNKAWESEEKMKDAERSVNHKEAEFQEAKALLDQKIKYLETSLEESRRREKEYMNDLKSQKKDHTSSVKDIHSRFENQLKNYQSRLESETEKISELERELEEKENLYERSKANWEETELRLKSMNDDYLSQLEMLKTKLDRKENETKKKIAELVRDHESSITKLQAKFEEVDQKFKQTDETLKSQQVQWQKENAILAQKLEFSEQHYEETKSQLEEERRQHANMLRSIQATSGENAREETEAQLQKLRQKYMEDMKSQEIEIESTKKKFTSQVEDLLKKNAELEFQIKVETNEWSNKEKNFQEELTVVTEDRNKLQEQCNELQKRLQQFSEEAEAKLKKRIKTLENTLEELRTKTNDEIQAANARAESSYQQLKEFYEEEKKRMEGRLQEEKERADKKYNIMSEEYEDRLRQEADAYEDDLAAKEDELHDLEAYYNDEITQLKHQSGLDTQKIETLEKYLKDNKEQIEAMQKTHNLSMEQLQERMNSERASLVEKVEKMASELAAKERELSSVSYKKEQLESQLANKEAELSDVKEQYDREKQTLAEKFELAKQSYQKINDEYTQKKSDFKREMALSQQENEFKAKRISDLEKSLQEAEEKYNETLKSLKDESGEELSTTIQKLTKEKESLEEKLNQKKKSLKELATSSSKNISSLEKEKAVLAEKLANLEAKKQDMENRLRADIEHLQVQLKEKKDSESTDKMSVHLENERLKTMMQEMEKDISERNSAFERERILWENKFNFLTQQRDSAKADLAESQRKFDITVENLQKRSAAEKEKQESATNLLISSIETRFTTQIKDMQEAHASSLSETIDKNKILERDLRAVKEELELVKRGRSSESGSLEKRVKDLSESEQRLLAEIDALKKDRERRIEELSESANYEKEQLKTKLADYEKRAKEAEHQKGQLFLDLEKERAKWNMEKDHLLAQKNEAMDSLERSEKRRESLVRDNEKLRAEKGKRVGGAFAQRPPGSSQFNKGVTGLFQNAGISFEEFSKEKESQDTSGNSSPRSSTAGTASPLPPMRARSPISSRNHRSSSGFDFNKIGEKKEGEK
ncbi:unnamed protein product [Blepharisma stoltei]|uniref:GB1/RHD3-type G domain-containing protein n=1 Tax=Blepharisma stoltei TaxID=1481888 RepID=A0AAU9J088_9CILI|nr:unnamed protein product [Blepharisma stoltei]